MTDTPNIQPLPDSSAPMEHNAPDITPVAPPDTAPQIQTEAKRILPKNIYIAGGVLLVAILITAILYIKSTLQAPAAPVAVPTPIIVITPTPMRMPSRIASSSAFVTYQNAVASLSGTINAFTILDSTLTPPVLNTDLGLSP